MEVSYRVPAIFDALLTNGYRKKFADDDVLADELRYGDQRGDIEGPFIGPIVHRTNPQKQDNYMQLATPLECTQ